MSDGLLEILRYFLLALLWLFFIYAGRLAFVEVRRGRSPDREPISDNRRSGRGDRRSPGRLRIVDPPELRDHSFDLGGEITVGRSPGCVVALPEDTFASSVHARIFARDGESWVEDLGSTNGTFVNGQRLQAPSRLKRGDRIKIGNSVLEVAR